MRQGVYYRPLDWEKEVDEAFYKQLGVAKITGPGLKGDCSHLISAGHRRLLQTISNNFLSQVVEDSMRR